MLAVTVYGGTLLNAHIIGESQNSSSFIMFSWNIKQW